MSGGAETEFLRQTRFLRPSPPDFVPLPYHYGCLPYALLFTELDDIAFLEQGVGGANVDAALVTRAHFGHIFGKAAQRLHARPCGDLFAPAQHTCQRPALDIPVVHHAAGDHTLAQFEQLQHGGVTDHDVLVDGLEHAFEGVFDVLDHLVDDVIVADLDARLLVRVTARAEDSALAALSRLIELGAQSRSSYVRLADKAAALYVPVVHGLALLAFAGGLMFGLGAREALLRAVVVLIVTCPCALGLAVPAVQITASGRLFRLGVLVKSGAALERLAEVDTVVFDKTGVLTEGRPRLVDADAALVAEAAPLARASRHPLALSLAQTAGPGPVAAEVVETAGQGLEGVIDGRRARLGRAAFVGATADAGSETELWFGYVGETPRRMAFADTPRGDAAETIAALRRRGLKVEILSGDLPAAVGAVASACGIEDWRGGLTPFDKVAALDALKSAGRRALMVGDGLNDAAALARSHASMAPGAAVDAAQNAADLVFQGEGLWAVVAAVDIARAARRRALENFAFSALYNVVAAPAAILGLVNPLVAAVAMSGSSLVVTLNALRMSWAGRATR